MKHAVLKLVIFMMIMVATAQVATPTHWRVVAPGLEYAQFKQFSHFHFGVIHAFKIDLKNYNLGIVFAKEHLNNIATVRDLTLQSKALVGINGGFFSQELQPLGLRIDHSKIKNPLKGTKWWGVFYVSGEKASIVSQPSFVLTKSINFAIQSGPRLIVNGRIPPLKNGVDSRSALGITRSGKVVLLATDRVPITTQQLATLLRKSGIDGGLDCDNALNLDGGSSTQLFANVSGFILDVSGVNAVTDAVVVVPRDH